MITKINNISIAYDESGHGQPLVLVHGYPLSRQMWAPQLAGLSDAARVLAPDLRGHGESQAVPGPYWMNDLADDLNAFLDALGVNQPVVLCGLSMGGYGTWSWASLYPDRFAAIAPICGGGPSFLGFPRRVCALKEVPVWAFHGAQDDTVPLSESEILVKTLAGCGGDVRFTVYPDAGHDSWTPTYANPQLYAWFLEHRRDGRRQKAGDPFEPG
jgi:pimeloyl-ACP methyl ester carboxylesterase